MTGWEQVKQPSLDLTNLNKLCHTMLPFNTKLLKVWSRTSQATITLRITFLISFSMDFALNNPQKLLT